MVPIMDETPGRYDVTVTVARDGCLLPDPVTFAVAADRAAWCRSASIVSAHTADKIICVVTVNATDRHAAAVTARAVVSDALQVQVPSPEGSEASGTARRSRGQPVRSGRRAGPASSAAPALFR
jgi:hypothetical protein